MPKVIYTNEVYTESKDGLYILLLQLNDRFTSDIDKLRERFNIKVPEKLFLNIDELSSDSANLIDNKTFMNEVAHVAEKIKIEGKWSVHGLALYVLGCEPILAIEREDEYVDRIEIESRNEKPEPYVEVRIYGYTSREQLTRTIKDIYETVRKTNGKSIKSLDESVLFRNLVVHKLRKEGKNYNEISHELNLLGDTTETYDKVRRQYSDYLKYAERFY